MDIGRRQAVTIGELGQRQSSSRQSESGVVWSCAVGLQLLRMEEWPAEWVVRSRTFVLQGELSTSRSWVVR